MTILDALADPHLFGALPAFRDLETWSAWETFLASVYGLPMTTGRARDLPGSHRPRSATA